MQLKGEKKEVTVTDKYQHTPNPQAKAALNKDCSLHLGIPHSHWLDERKRTEGRMKQDASGILAPMRWRQDYKFKVTLSYGES